MSYRPVRCDSCARISLIRRVTWVPQAGCPACGSSTQAVSSPDYLAEDLPLFIEVERLVHASALTAEGAADVLDQLRDAVAAAKSAQPILREIAVAKPRLGALETTDKYDAGRVLHMLMVILSACANAPLVLGTSGRGLATNLSTLRSR